MTTSHQNMQQKMFCTIEQLDYIFHHLILPVKVPGHDDTSASNEEFLIDFVLKCLTHFTKVSAQDDEIISRHCIPMLENMRDARGSRGFLDYTGVKDTLKKISAEGKLRSRTTTKSITDISTGNSSLYHVTEQNAGLIIRKTTDSFCFETFELSPTNKAAMTTKGRLIRNFPATATEISAEDFNNPSFQDVLTRTVVKMGHQAVAEMQPKVKKAQQMHDEERDTTNPRIVTELLTSFLRGAGSLVEIKAIRKHTREEVSWHNSSSPWRRSPLWLLIRVGLQLTMTSYGAQHLYKRFMVFLTAQALYIAHEKKSSSETIHLMMAKIARRLCKLENVEDGEWLHTAKEIVSSASASLKERWTNIQQRNEKPLDPDSLAGFDFQDHASFSLKDLDTFLATIPQRQNQSTTVAFSPRTINLILEPDKLPTGIGYVNTDNKSFELAAIESWVQANLDKWVQDNISMETSCHMLKGLFEQYHLSAEKWYATRPEGMSRMLLTLGELWVAIDKMAVHHYPLLLKYSPEVPAEVWSDLLIHSKSDMERLHRLESYIIRRTEAAKENRRPSALSSYGLILSFSVEYFQQYPKLQAKKQQIEDKAQRERDASLRQYRDLKANYDAIMKKYDETECEQVLEVKNDMEYYVHPEHRCKRCALPAQAKKLKMKPHEWPLPADELDAQTTIFEMDVPVAFAVWRDATVYFLDNILGFQSFNSSEAGYHPRSSYPLGTYKALTPWFESQRHRIQLLSETKPHANTHRNHKLIEHSTEADVCLNNGLRFQYHDNSRNTFISQFSPTTEISERCTIKLPQRAHSLRRFLARTWNYPNGETPNQVISSQSECPEYMSLGEFKALAVLPYGYSLQWMSILTQLAMPTVDFNKPETAIFLLQMMLQAGPYQSDNISRQAHTRPTELQFGRQLLVCLNECLSRVQENWESYTSICSFTCLATRFLALADNSLSKQILGLITRCRMISYRWVMHLLAKIQNIDDCAQQKEFVETAVHIALICIGTFNLEGGFFENELADEQQAAILLEISIIIHNNADIQRVREDPLYSFMLHRYEITMHRARPILVQEIISKESSCLDLAIEQRWPDFSRHGQWSLASCHWVNTVSGNLQVHFDLLHGELLVNGSPVSRLPRGYETHNEYQKLFGSVTMEVMPSNLPGMRFCSTKLIQGYTVYLGMQPRNQGDDLLVRLCKKNSILDMIPSRTLRGHLPRDFVEDYLHWRYEASGDIEFRPVSNPWPCSNSDNWYLKKRFIRWNISVREESFLLTHSSQLGQRISKIFSRLQAPSDLHLIFHQDRKKLEIQLPKLRLEFLMSSGRSSIKSRQFRHMEVDREQAIGTLIGLENKLVLRNSHDPSVRSVLIPEGTVTYRKSTGFGVENHVDVSIDSETVSRVQIYRLDPLLCRIVPNDKVESKLYLAYLHARTSYCLPDPFIQRTGTEEAMTILNSASVRAPTAFSEDAYATLSDIAKLSPKRSFYPVDKQVMQNVSWSNETSYLSQDDRFANLAQQIIERSREVEFLFPKHKVIIFENRAPVGLVYRAINRSSGTRLSGFGAEDFTTKYDVEYVSREKSTLYETERSVRAVEMASRVYKNDSSLSRPVANLLGSHLYEVMTTEGHIQSRSILPNSRIHYDSSWLQGPSYYLSSVWCQLHNSYQKTPRWFDKFELMVWMATMSYSLAYDPHVVQALLMFTQSRTVAESPLPTESSYDLSLGRNVKEQELRASALSHAVSFGSSPDASTPGRHGETSKRLGKRRKGEYKHNSDIAVARFTNSLKRQWPERTPTAPEDQQVKSYIRVELAMQKVSNRWFQWQKNLDSKKYLDTVVSRMRDIAVEDIHVSSEPSRTSISTKRLTKGFVATTYLFSESGVYHHISPPNLDQLVIKTTRSGKNTKLTGIIDNLDSSAKLGYERRYLRELRDSLSSLHGHVESELIDGKLANLPDLLQGHLLNCESHLTNLYESLVSSLLSSSMVPETTRGILQDTGFLLRLSPTQLLQHLKPSRWKFLSAGWKESLIHYGMAIAALQQAKRLIRFQSSHVDLIRELENSGHKSWSPYDHPEWLLLECESEIMIRDVQQQIAKQMIDPPEALCG
ncbi:hypothetical protein IL306_011135, partial [Fusarium sp. DS 682]